MQLRHSCKPSLFRNIFLMRRYLLLLLLCLSGPSETKSQDFDNLDFEKVCEDTPTSLCSWSKSWGSEQSCKAAISNGNRHLLIEGQSENAVGFVEQVLEVKPGKTYRILNLFANIKTEGVVGKGAGLNIGVYDDDGKLISTKDMGGYYSVSWIKGDSEWANYNISIVCPKEAQLIKIGAILYGKGKARFDNYEVLFSDLNERKPNKLAKNFVAQAVKYIRKNSLVRDSVDFSVIRKTASKIAGDADSYKACYLAVEFMLEALRPFGDHHSFFMTKDEAKNWENNEDAEENIDFPTFKFIKGCGYLLVPPFHGGNSKLIEAYADSLQAGIRQMSKMGIQGWIVDLRENTGGNMEPMIAGLGPLFDSQKLGSLVDVKNKTESWFYKNGVYFWEDEKGVSVTDPFEFETELPIAVLTNSRTGSSGEIVAISFIGNSKTKSFGEATWGLTTGNGEFEMKDGSKMFLASTIMADRNGKQYHGPIEPDQIIKSKDSKTDTVFEEAMIWINNHY